MSPAYQYQIADEADLALLETNIQHGVLKDSAVNWYLLELIRLLRESREDARIAQQERTTSLGDREREIDDLEFEVETLSAQLEKVTDNLQDLIKEREEETERHRAEIGSLWQTVHATRSILDGAGKP
jgi:chromosome segregation ATPase